MRRLAHHMKILWMIFLGLLLSACIREFPTILPIQTDEAVVPMPLATSLVTETTVTKGMQETVPVIPTSTVNPVPTLTRELVQQTHSPTPPELLPSLQPSQETSLVFTNYNISATLDYDSHHLKVQQQIDYINRSSQVLGDLTLVVDTSRFYNAFKLNSLTWDDGQRVNPYVFRDAKIYFLLRQPLNPGERVILLLEYELQLPNTTKYAHIRPYPFGYTEAQASIGDWYPFVPPYDPVSGWIVHPPSKYGEHLLYDIANYDVTIALSGGNREVVIAASAPAEIDGESLRYHHPAARSFAWSASPYYRIATGTVDLSPGNSVEVLSYYLPMYEKAGQRVLQTTLQALKVYSELFGTYPHPSLSAVQANFLDGMEYDGLYFLSEDFYNWHNGTETDYLVAIAAHETAHQWWYAVVGNDPAIEPWLDEALSTYCERYYFEISFPDAIDWWWTYRIDYYQPKGFIDISIYDVEGDYRAYRDVIYLQGAHFFDDLRQLLGDQVFLSFLRSYYKDNAYGIATFKTFLAALEQQASIDFTPTLREYLSHYQP